MDYRRLDYSNDIEEVVALIRRNLNPNYSEEILKWKHLESPSGKSVGFVAVADRKIVGVVFTVAYIFKNNTGKKIRSIRFFDACTDPDQRGKGIFKTLMKMGFDYYKNEYDFSFSNPNNASLKGHLRVGYREPEEKWFFRLGIIQPIFGKIQGQLRSFPSKVLDQKPLMEQNFYLTGNSTSFLNWRYREERYNITEFIRDDQANYLVYRIERKKGVRAIVICDYLGNIRLYHEVVNKVCRKEKTFLVYYLDNQINSGLKFLFVKEYKKAGIVFKSDFSNIPDNLVISLGDLEGRL